MGMTGNSLYNLHYNCVQQKKPGSALIYLIIFESKYPYLCCTFFFTLSAT
jgi:hypothetical protein